MRAASIGRRLGEAPGRVEAVLAGPEQAERVAVEVAEVGLAPQPGLVDGADVEHEALLRERGDPRVEVGALEVDDDAGVADESVGVVQREGAVAVEALEAGVPGQAGDDLPQAGGDRKRRRGRRRPTAA